MESYELSAISFLKYSSLKAMERFRNWSVVADTNGNHPRRMLQRMKRMGENNIPKNMYRQWGEFVPQSGLRQK